MLNFKVFSICAVFVLVGQPGAEAKDVVMDMVISYFPCAPDGVTKLCLGVNGQFPGPTIRATIGDTLVLRVTNLIDSAETGQLDTTMHWHGIEMYLQPWFDGPAGVTQCMILYGESMEYRFTVFQAGTYWYHSHHMWQYVDGLWGLIIIDNDPEIYTYDGEFIVPINDWHHAPAANLSYIYKHNDTRIPVPDSGLIRGRGTYDCTSPWLGNYPCDASQTSIETLTVAPGKTYRFRVINTSARALFNFSIDGHQLRAIEVDGVDTVEVGPVDYAELWPAQRYSFLVTMSGEPDVDAYWIRADMLPFDNNGANGTDDKYVSQARAVLQYDREFCPAADAAATNLASSSSAQEKKQGRPARHELFDWAQLMTESKTARGRIKNQKKILDASRSRSSAEFEFPPVAEVIATNTANIKAKIGPEVESEAAAGTQTVPLPTTTGPSNPIKLEPNLCRPWRSRGSFSAPDYYDQQVVLNAKFHWDTDPPYVNHAMINCHEYTPNISNPVIYQMIKGLRVGQDANPQEIPNMRQVIQVVINNDDREGHPWHLHGHTFWVLGVGVDGNETHPNFYNAALHEPLLNVSGVRRDTVHTNIFSWTVIRFETDNPGAWLLHCHIDWHLEIGLGAVFIEGQNVLKTLLNIPEEPKRVCACSGIDLSP